MLISCGGMTGWLGEQGRKSMLFVWLDFFLFFLSVCFCARKWDPDVKKRDLKLMMIESG